MNCVFRMLNLFLFFSASLLFAQSQHEGHGSHGGAPELRQGRYVGYIKMDGRNEKIAVQGDLFVQSGENPAVNPKLIFLLKFSFGGYHTSEYFTQVYQDIRYDYETGDLELDEPTNDLVFTAKSHSMEGVTHLFGQVWSRFSSRGGEFFLQSASDEPTAVSSDVPFAPRLEGQYTGRCNGKMAAFQIQTGRGLKFRDASDGRDLFDYQIVGRVALSKKAVASPNSESAPWLVQGDFAGGIYNPFIGHLVFLGPSSTAIDCNLHQGRLTCSYRLPKLKIKCQFDRDDKTIQPPTVYKPQFHLNPTQDQLKELPVADARMKSRLIELLKGDYAGYLHHESTNRYQPMSLHVVASASTENPHNDTKIFVSTTSVLYYGRTHSDQFMSQRYEPRAFYIRPGFALSAPGTDSFIQIEEWKTGYIRGVWYSKNFGRVGRVELVKGEAGQLPNSLSILPQWEGEFQSTFGKGDARDNQHWFYLIFSNPAAERLDSSVPFMGSYQTVTNISKIEPIERGRYDPYTSTLAWSFSVNGGTTIVTGKVDMDGRLMMYWPPAPGVFSVWMYDYALMTYRKVAGAASLMEGERNRSSRDRRF